MNNPFKPVHVRGPRDDRWAERIDPTYREAVRGIQRDGGKR